MDYYLKDADRAAVLPVNLDSIPSSSSSYGLVGFSSLLSSVAILSSPFSSSS